MTEHYPDEPVADPIPAWDPFAQPEAVTHPVKASGGRATVTYRPWSGRERLRYEDLMTSGGIITKGLGDDDVETDEDTIKLGRMRLLASCLTMRSSAGFPSAPGFPGPFDVSDPRQVITLASDVLGELLETALKVQPLPKGEAEDEEQDAETGAASDPSPTPSTPAEATRVESEPPVAVSPLP